MRLNIYNVNLYIMRPDGTEIVLNRASNALHFETEAKAEEFILANKIPTDKYEIMDITHEL